MSYWRSWRDPSCSWCRWTPSAAGTGITPCLPNCSATNWTGPGLAPALHRRASAWHRRHGSITDAIDHAIVAGDLEDARDLIASHWQRLLSEGLIETVDTWLDRLPPEMVAEDSRMCLIRAWVARFLGRLDEIGPWLTAIESAAPAGPY